MKPEMRPTLTTRCLGSLARVGRPGRIVGQRLDRVRIAGWRNRRLAWQVTGRRAQDALFERQAGLYRRIWGEAATAVGADLEHLGHEFLAIRRGGVETVVRFHLVMFDHPATIALALDKALIHQLLTDAGLPVPAHRRLGEIEQTEALVFAAENEGGVVVKPANGTGGGTGVTCGVETVEDLARAEIAASIFDRDILIEQAMAGEEYRLLFLDGKLLGVVRRDRPKVVGDGQSTVAELMAAENQRRLDAGEEEVARLLRVDLDCALALRRRGWTAHSVPPKGQEVVVKGTVGENARKDNRTFHGLAESIVESAARASALARIRFAGVDLVTPDATRPLEQAGGAILEVNGTPGLHYHYEVANAEDATAVAIPLLEQLLDEGAAR
jgi:cyanophycin synthetase